jgi:hypothetical protein
VLKRRVLMERESCKFARVCVCVRERERERERKVSREKDNRRYK